MDKLFAEASPRIEIDYVLLRNISPLARMIELRDHVIKPLLDRA